MGLGWPLFVAPGGHPWLSPAKAFATGALPSRRFTALAVSGHRLEAAGHARKPTDPVRVLPAPVLAVLRVAVSGAEFTAALDAAQRHQLARRPAWPSSPRRRVPHLALPRIAVLFRY